MGGGEDWKQGRHVVLAIFVHAVVQKVVQLVVGEVVPSPLLFLGGHSTGPVFILLAIRAG